MVLNFVFAVVEIIAGVFSNSLVLVAEALHDATDVFALGIAFVASRKAQKLPNKQNTFGFARATVIASVITSAMLVVGAIFIFFKAFERLMDPQPVDAGLVLVVALLGFFVNGFVALKVLRNKKDLNIKTLVLHMAEDALGWAAVFVSAAIILFTGFTLIDPLLTFVVGLIVFWSALRVLKEGVDVLMEGVPENLEVDKIKEALSQIKGVVRVHDLHVWSISSGFSVLTCHLGVQNIYVAKAQEISLSAKNLMKKKFDIIHSTIELECVDCEIIDGELVCKI